MKIIQETGYEGNIYNNFQVLNFHEKSGSYYTRINICGVYKIARMPLQDIINNIVPDKFPGKLVGNPYLHLDDGTTIIFDINGIEIYIDTEDFNKIKGITWRAHEPTCGRSIDNAWYAYGGVWDKSEKYSDTPKGGKWIQYSLHRYILDIFDENIEVDHKDMNGLNNRKNNLRKASQIENARHKSLYKNSETGFTGVRLDKRTGIYQARITVNGKQIFLGESKDIEVAKKLRIDAEKKYFGEFKTHRN